MIPRLRHSLPSKHSRRLLVVRVKLESFPRCSALINSWKHLECGIKFPFDTNTGRIFILIAQEHANPLFIIRIMELF
jgi:hypothetical protein